MFAPGIHAEIAQVVRDAAAEARSRAVPAPELPDGHFMNPTTTDAEIADYLHSLGFHRTQFPR